MKSFKDLIYSHQAPVLVFDGAMGTALQELNLTAADFGGISLEGCNENLVRTSPASVEHVHKLYLEAGCDVIETNTFGANSIVLQEYNIEKDAYLLNYEASILAKKVADQYSTIKKPRFVAGSIGPTTKLPTLGHIYFDELADSYEEQARGLIEGQVDLLLIETCQDVLQIKCALSGINKAIDRTGISVPIMVSVTIETTGTMLLGTDIASIVTILEPFNIDILGLNCATGPEQMKPHIEYLSKHSPFLISCIPNAGLPENVGGKAHYRLKPIELKMQLMHFIYDLGVNFVGGCCGTTPEHIKLLSKSVDDLEKLEPYITRNHSTASGVTSIYEKTTYKQDNSILIIGERLNASGSKKVRDLLNEEDWDGLLSVAKQQQKEQAHVLDINVDYVGRNGIEDMDTIISKLVTKVNIPLMIDSTDYQKMESGLKRFGGKCILNSTNYEDGNDRFITVLSLCKKYGSAVVIGTIDEEGMARSCNRKISIVERSYKDSIEFGISESDIFYDPLVLPISTGLEEDRHNALETIEAIKVIKSKYPNVHIILGISNISFGLNPAARITLNSIFLDECIKAGLDSAIVSPSKILSMLKIDKQHKKVCLDLIYDKRLYKNNICIYDPLTELTRIFSNISSDNLKKNPEEFNLLSVEERLKKHIIDGEKTNLESNLMLALEKYKPLHIINQFLLDGMKVVGDLFGSGKMQLPFVLQSAETMKSAVSILEPFMDKEQSSLSSKGKLLIATVKGDVHDIGKNLVDIILSNNGYQVINLGIKQDIKEIISAQKEFRADCIAMSGLLVKSTAFMKENLSILNDNNISIPVILGGAALTPKFVNNDCNNTYKGVVIYGKDAFTDLKFMDSYMNAKNTNNWDNIDGFIDKDKSDFILPIKNIKQSPTLKANKKVEDPNLFSQDLSRSTSIDLISPIKPPFIGTRIIDKDSILIEKLFYYLDKNALYSSQWQLKREKSQTKEEYIKFLNDKASVILDKWKNIILENNLIRPSIVYGYFPCASNNNILEIFDFNNSNLLGIFEFPRQKSNNRYCISDFYHPKQNDIAIDYIPMQAVTMGEVTSNYGRKLFEENRYSDYLYFHGLTVQLSEALAEYSHSIIRNECGFEAEEPTNIQSILAQKYRGCRYSFGYPACPNVSDSKKQLEWLNAKRIGLYMDDSDQLIPEQSTTAIISLHSQAKYFSA